MPNRGVGWKNWSVFGACRCGGRNHFKAFPFFAAGVLVAQMYEAPQHLVDTLAIIFIALRVIYTILRFTNRASLRSVAWALSIPAVVGRFAVTAIYS